MQSYLLFLPHGDFIKKGNRDKNQVFSNSRLQS